MTETFPFGQPVRAVEQIDRTPKKVFVLGVYASAVHARWVDTDGNEVVKALAVASEPEIFWTGEGAAQILSGIQIPRELGILQPPALQFNGPSGKALDDLILRPLGLDRVDAWLCDLVPRSRMNASQQAAIRRAYLPCVEAYDLSRPSVPAVPKLLADDSRRQEILAEIVESKAHTLVLLGDQPIRWFLRHFDSRWTRLSDFRTDDQSYGTLHNASIGNIAIRLLPVAHPRQIARLGPSSARWYELHQHWMQHSAPDLLRRRQE